ncbi:MAG TPA: TOBE domain-containing protein, partial [Actinomycetota bacterium]|nr:TOBE domain-containing protein [Actinomycetota bacterium]
VGTPRDVYDRPVNLFVATFVGTPPMNVIRASMEAKELRAGGMVLGTWDSGRGDVLVGARPEHVHVRGSRWSGGTAEGPVLPATVGVVEPAGDQALLLLETAAGPLVARVEPSFAPRRGDQLEVWLDQQRLHLFDPGSERAIER